MSQSLDSTLNKVVLDDNDNNIYINGNKISCLTSNYYKNVIYLETDTSGEFRFRYFEIYNTICLLDGNDDCQSVYNLEKRVEELEK